MTVLNSSNHPVRSNLYGFLGTPLGMIEKPLSEHLLVAFFSVWLPAEGDSWRVIRNLRFANRCYATADHAQMEQRVDIPNTDLLISIGPAFQHKHPNEVPQAMVI